MSNKNVLDAISFSYIDNGNIVDDKELRKRLNVYKTKNRLFSKIIIHKEIPIQIQLLSE